MLTDSIKNVLWYKWLFVNVFYISACPSMPTFNDISSHASCYIPDTCTALDCCIEVDRIKRQLRTYIDIDTCNYKLTVGIEKLYLEYSLVDYQWGKKEKYSLFGLLNLQ